MTRTGQMLAIVVFAISWAAVRAQDVGVEYRASLGARSVALAGAGLTLPAGPLSSYYNPAAFGFMEQGAFLADYSNLYLANVHEATIAAASPILIPHGSHGLLSAGLMINFEGFDDSELRHGRYLISAALGLSVFSRIAVGGNFKVATIDGQLETAERPAVTGSGTGLDLSLHYHQPFAAGSLVQLVEIVLAGYDVYDTRVRYQPENRSDLLFQRSLRAGAAVHLHDLFKDRWHALKQPMMVLESGDRWHLGGETTVFEILSLRGGYAHDFGEPSESVITAGFGLDLGQQFAGIRLDYAYEHPEFLSDRHVFTVTVPAFKGPPPLAVSAPVFEPIFASYYRTYEQNSAVQHNSIQVENLSSAIIYGKCAALSAPYGISLEQENIPAFTLKPEERQTVRLPLQISSEILNTAELSQIVSARLRLEYRSAGSEKLRQFDQEITLVVHGKNYLRWDEAGRLAAFITPQDRQVQYFREQTAQPLNHPFWGHLHSIYRAAQFYEALAQNHFNYLPDTKLRFDSLYAAQDFDRVKYPAELLAAEGGSRRGDCDDLVALYCSILESDNIATAIVGSSDHLLMLFDTGIPLSKRAFLPLPDSLLLPFSDTGDLGLDGRIWLPVEVTALGDLSASSLGFYEAMQLGATYVRQVQNIDSLFEITSTEYASIKHRAHENLFREKVGHQEFETSLTRMSQAIVALDQSKMNYEAALFVRALSPTEDGFAAALQLATFAAFMENWQTADSIMAQREQSFGDRFELWNNWGNVALLAGHFQRAGACYEEALRLNPDFLQGYLNRTVLHLAMLEDHANAADSLNALMRQDSLQIQQLSFSQHRTRGVALSQLYGLTFMERLGRGEQKSQLHSEKSDSARVEISKTARKEAGLIEKAKRFFVRLSQFMSPPDPQVRRKFVAAGRGAIPTLSETRLLELLYWCAAPTATIVTRN